MKADAGRFLEDRASLDAIVKCMPDFARAEYLSYGALELLAGFPNRQLVVYTLARGRPTDIELLRLGNMQLVGYSGPTVEVAGEQESVLVGVTPVQILPGRDLFLQVPQRFEFKWKGKVSDSGGVQFAPHYTILTKTRSKEFHQVESHTYCVTLNQFRERFPEVPVRY